MLVVIRAVEAEDNKAEDEHNEESEDSQEQGSGFDTSVYQGEAGSLAAETLDVCGGGRPFPDGVGSSSIVGHHVGRHRVVGRARHRGVCWGRHPHVPVVSCWRWRVCRHSHLLLSVSWVPTVWVWHPWHWLVFVRHLAYMLAVEAGCMEMGSSCLLFDCNCFLFAELFVNSCLLIIELRLGAVPNLNSNFLLFQEKLLCLIMISFASEVFEDRDVYKR
jgi:hypothetical protein